MGIIYQLDRAGNYSALYKYPSNAPGGFPTWMIEASDGDLYGTTIGNVNSPQGHSEIFRLTKKGVYTTLHAWSSSVCQCEIVQGSDGLIYRVAQTGAEFFSLDASLPKPIPQPAPSGLVPGPEGAARVLAAQRRPSRRP